MDGEGTPVARLIEFMRERCPEAVLEEVEPLLEARLGKAKDLGDRLSEWPNGPAGHSARRVRVCEVEGALGIASKSKGELSLVASQEVGECF